MAQEAKRKINPKFNIQGGVSFQEAVHLGASVGENSQLGISAGFIPGIDRKALAVSFKQTLYQYGRDEYHIKSIYTRLNVGTASQETNRNQFLALTGGLEIPFQSVQSFTVGLETGVLHILSKNTLPAFGVRINYAFYERNKAK